MDSTYSPEDNKLRLYSATRLDAETYARVKAAGFSWAPKQELFVAPTWTPDREDLLTDLCGDVGDEDTSLVERAEERADRFGNYGEKRQADADAAHAAVSRIADGIPFGQPILVGHHSEKHARRDAEKIENGMRRAVKMWETATYWKSRAAGAIRAAKYKERPDVRARRIKTIESDQRKQEREKADAEKWLRSWAKVAEPGAFKRKDGSLVTPIEAARFLANYCHLYVATQADGTGRWTAWDVLQSDEERYKECPAMTVEDVQAIAARVYPQQIARCERWLNHYANRLEYERAMLAAAGGTVADRTGPEKGGACRCWASPQGGWSYIVKVNKVSVGVFDNWGNGGQNFTRTIPFDKLTGVMTAAEVEAARAAGRLIEAQDTTGFYLVKEGAGFDPPRTRYHQPGESNEPETPAPDNAFQAMRESLKAGVQVVTAPQLFPTPPKLARRVVALAEIEPGHRVLEPSAGTGNLLAAMGGRMFAHDPERGAAVAVEVNGALAERLRREFPLTNVRCADFLTCNGDLGTFDRIVMNPPFTNGDDIRHIQHARTFLKPGGRLVAICANGPRQRDALMADADEWIDLEPGSFASEGTNVNAAIVVFTGAV